MDGVVSFRREAGAPSDVAQTVAVAEVADALELCLARDDCAAVSVGVLRRAGTALEALLHRQAQVERGDELPPSRRRITYVRDSTVGYVSRPIPAPPAGVQQRMTLQRATLLCDSAAPWLLAPRCAGFAFEAPQATEHAANATVRVVQLARYDSAVDVADADAFGRWFFAARQEAPAGACLADAPRTPPRLAAVGGAACSGGGATILERRVGGTRAREAARAPARRAADVERVLAYRTVGAAGGGAAAAEGRMARGAPGRGAAVGGERRRAAAPA